MMKSNAFEKGLDLGELGAAWGDVIHSEGCRVINN